MLVDGAQAVAHVPCDVTLDGADFYVFSGHKIYGPAGIGVLYGKRELPEAMPPWQGGGGMIDEVRFERTTYAPPPGKFEAGTPNVAGAVGLHAALDYFASAGISQVVAHEQLLLERMHAALGAIPGLRFLARPMLRAGAISFSIDGFESAAVARHLDRDGIAVRAGHHCAQPALRRYGYSEIVRASLALYNTEADVDALAASLQRLVSRRTGPEGAAAPGKA